jgi:hypothetical protein
VSNDNSDKFTFERAKTLQKPGQPCDYFKTVTFPRTQMRFNLYSWCYHLHISLKKLGINSTDEHDGYTSNAHHQLERTDIDTIYTTKHDKKTALRPREYTFDLSKTYINMQ